MVHHSRREVVQNREGIEWVLTEESRKAENHPEEGRDDDAAARSVGGDGSSVRRSKLDEIFSFVRGVG